MLVRISLAMSLLFGCHEGFEDQGAKVATSGGEEHSEDARTASPISIAEADVAEDGVINELDLQAVSNWFGGEFPTTPVCIKNPDVNQDGKINISDLVSVARHKGKKVPATERVEKVFITWEEADLNDDGVINILDLVLAGRELNDIQPWLETKDVQTIEDQGNGQGAVITVSEADYDKNGIIDHVDGLAIFTKFANVYRWFGKEEPSSGG